METTSNWLSYPLVTVVGMSLLTDLAAARGTDLTALDDAGLADLGRLIGRGRRDLAAFATAVAVEAKRRQASGSSPCPDDLSDPDGERSRRRGRRTRLVGRSVGTCRSPAPGRSRGRPRRRMRIISQDGWRGSPSEKARLARHDRKIASNAASLRPEAFRTWLARVLVTIADPPDGDDGLSAAERAKAAASWMMFVRPDGTWAVAASMDDERGAQMDAAVTARAREIAGLRPPGQRKVTANDRARAAFELLCGITLGGSGADDERPWRRSGGGGAGGSGPPAGGSPMVVVAEGTRLDRVRSAEGRSAQRQRRHRRRPGDGPEPGGRDRPRCSDAGPWAARGVGGRDLGRPSDRSRGGGAALL